MPALDCVARASVSAVSDEAPFSPVVVEDPEALDGLADVWTRLWSATRPLPPMLEYRWASTWWKIHRSAGKLLLIIVLDGAGRPVGIAPLYRRRDLRHPVRMLRTISFLGTGEREADEVASEYLGWLAAPEHVTAVSGAVGQVLRERAGTWDRVWLVNVSREQDLHRRLQRELAPASREVAVTARPTFQISVRPVEEFVAGLSSSNFRHRCRRALRAGAEARIELVTPTRPQEIEGLFAALAALHQKRWRERGRPGVFDSAVFRDFHARLLPGYLADGTAWLAGLRQGNQWLAARYHLRAADRVFDYVSGVDTSTSAALGPGLLLTLHALEWCVRNGVRTYDLLAGDYDYKRKLATEVAQIFDIDAFGRGMAARLWLAARRLKTLTRRDRASTLASTCTRCGARPGEPDPCRPAPRG
jgi:CelD/BcsL family acetyltransferase involved in cellulose biosynthesis